jgi:ribosomal protein S27AE
MDVDYFYCASCGYEAHGIFVAYSRATAGDEWYLCPLCGEESSHAEHESYH